MTLKLRISLLLILFLYACLVDTYIAVVSNAFAAVDADYVLTNGKIYTVNEKQPWATAVAIQGTDIVYVGEEKGARKFIGEDTIVTDLRGKMMLPGFIDTHSHTMLVMGMASGLMMDTPADGMGDKDKMLAAVADCFRKRVARTVRQAHRSGMCDQLLGVGLEKYSEKRV